MSTDGMVWVAEDPTQPGSAWALCDASEDYRKHAAASIAGWIKRGGNPKLVSHEVGGEMLRLWVRPEKRGALPERDTHTADLFAGQRGAV